LATKGEKPKEERELRDGGRKGLTGLVAVKAKKCKIRRENGFGNTRRKRCKGSDHVKAVYVVRLLAKVWTSEMPKYGAVATNKNTVLLGKGKDVGAKQGWREHRGGGERMWGGGGGVCGGWGGQIYGVCRSARVGGAGQGQ